MLANFFVAGDRMKSTDRQELAWLHNLSDDELDFRIEAWNQFEVDLKRMSKDLTLAGKRRAAASQLRLYASSNYRQLVNERERRVLASRVENANELLARFDSADGILRPVVSLHNKRLQTVQTARDSQNRQIQAYLDKGSQHFQKLLALVSVPTEASL
jgi:hypothetical protein